MKHFVLTTPAPDSGQLFYTGRPGDQWASPSRDDAQRFTAEEARNLRDALNRESVSGGARFKVASALDDSAPPVVGEVLVASWGYDQTNYEFWQIAQTTAKRVRLIPLANQLVSHEDMRTRVLPDLAAGADGPSIHRAVNYTDRMWVRVKRYAQAVRWDGGEKTATHTH